MYAGGILYRIVSDSLVQMVTDSLDQLNWFATDRGHLPVVMYPEPLDASESTKPNAVAFSMEDIVNADIELGSHLSEHRCMYFIDVYGESKALALHLGGDIKDILEGRFPSIGRGDNHFEVLDLAHATPTTLFYCDIEEVEIDRNRFGDRPYEKFWWTIGFELVFAFQNENSD
jgi:hypothetical protein